MTTVTASEPEREEKPIAELERDTWVQVIDADGDYLGEARVLHVETYEDSALGRRVMLIYRLPGYGPDTVRFPADMTLPLLTDDEVAEQMDRERRTAIAAQLDAVAELVSDGAVPLPKLWTAVEVRFQFGDDVDALAAFAEALGEKVAEHDHAYSASVNLIALQSGADDRSAGVDVFGEARRPKAKAASASVAADPTGQLYSRADEEPYAGDAVLTRPGRRTEAHFADGNTGEDLDETVPQLPAPKPIEDRCPQCGHWPWPGRHAGEQGCGATGGTLYPCGCTYAAPADEPASGA